MTVSGRRSIALMTAPTLSPRPAPPGPPRPPYVRAASAASRSASGAGSAAAAGATGVGPADQELPVVVGDWTVDELGSSTTPASIWMSGAPASANSRCGVADGSAVATGTPSPARAPPEGG